MVLELGVALLLEQIFDLGGKSRVWLFVEVSGDLGQEADGRINDWVDCCCRYGSVGAFDRMQMSACLVEKSDVLFEVVGIDAQTRQTGTHGHRNAFFGDLNASMARGTNWHELRAV